jgi:hypothetical protein
MRSLFSRQHNLMPRAAAATGRADYPPMLDARWRDATTGPVGEQFVAPVTVTAPATLGEYDETTHSRPETPGEVIYQGMGRLVPFGIGSTPENAGQTVTLRGYRLSIPYPGAVFKPGYRVRFDSDDPILNARVLTVSGQQSSSTRLQTDVLLEDNES